MPNTSGENVVRLSPREEATVDERLKADFQRLFCRQVAEQRNGHTGDIVPRPAPYEP